MELKRNEFLFDAQLILVGNKMDAEDSRMVSTQEGKDYANSQELGFAEVSARDGRGVHELFDSIAKTMI